MLNSYPNGCGIGETGDENYIECTRGQSFKKTGMLAGGILGTSLIGIFVLLLSITCHVYTIEKSLSTSSNALQRKNTRNDEPQTSSTPRVEEDLENHNDEPQSSSTPRIEEDFGEDECNSTPDAENVDEEPKEKESLTRGALKQSLLYIVAYIFTYSPLFVFFAKPEMVESKVGKSILLWSNSTILPIYGIFLILIYTRPKVQILSKMFPRAPWFLCFKVVLGSGGEVPPAHELKPSHLPWMSTEDGESPPPDSDLASPMSEDVSYEDLKSAMIAVSKSNGWSNQA
ncbi:predicted protein [Chaetoceros tenuissimus]|uniref:Uncharacterized protein n=1 Tax=Chaetoceros tenuissimus TaxID=426638 RepID=A0AAD3CZL4_9STRA|nr:predicted protein [Chaetoceros tenuissimus]